VIYLQVKIQNYTVYGVSTKPDSMEPPIEPPMEPTNQFFGGEFTYYIVNVL
jgi:hypothetical protein